VVKVKLPIVETVIEFVVAPVLHKKLPVPEAVSMTESPGQIVVLPLAEIIALGKGLTVTVSVAEAVPHALVDVTVYVPLVLTVIEEPDEPVLQL
jgi:hypothetical protein